MNSDLNKNFLNLVHTNFINLFGKENLEKIPNVDIGDRVGWTDYIDFINMDDFNGKGNVLKGIDKYNRPFISFLYKSKSTLYQTLYETLYQALYQPNQLEMEEVKDNYKITTLFQRYSDEHFWMYGGNVPEGLYCSGYNFETLSGDDRLFNVMNVLLRDKQVTYQYTKDKEATYHYTKNPYFDPNNISVSLYL